MPDCAPVPLQSEHLTYFLILSFFDTPVAISSSVSFNETRKSDPGEPAPFLLEPVLPEPKKSSKIEEPPNISEKCEKISFILENPSLPNPLPLTPSCPNLSYLAFFSSWLKISYASAASLNFSSAALSPGFRSG